jgi:hypothetical protein
MTSVSITWWHETARPAFPRQPVTDVSNISVITAAASFLTDVPVKPAQLRRTNPAERQIEE